MEYHRFHISEHLNSAFLDRKEAASSSLRIRGICDRRQIQYQQLLTSKSRTKLFCWKLMISIRLDFFQHQGYSCVSIECSNMFIHCTVIKRREAVAGAFFLWFATAGCQRNAITSAIIITFIDSGILWLICSYVNLKPRYAQLAFN